MITLPAWSIILFSVPSILFALLFFIICIYILFSDECAVERKQLCHAFEVEESSEDDT